MGLPLYHPLLTDAEERLMKFKSTIDRFGKHVRPAAAWEAEVLGAAIWERPFIIDIPRLDRAATVDDVAAGKA